MIYIWKYIFILETYIKSQWTSFPAHMYEAVRRMEIVRFLKLKTEYEID